MEQTVFGTAMQKAGASASKIGASVAQQWLQKIALAALVGGGVWSWNAIGRAKNRIILEPVRPELAKVNSRIDTVAKKVDSSLDIAEKTYRQNLTFQSAQLEVQPALREYIVNKKRLGATARARAENNEKLLDGLAQ
jgi:hypothetical protein